MSEEETTESMSDEEAIMKIAAAMKDNAGSAENKQSVHTFLFNVATADNPTRISNLRDDKELNELGKPKNSVRGLKELSLISEKIMDNNFFKDYFEKEAKNVLETSLSREGFLIRQATVQTKQVADITKRRKINKGWFGSKKEEISGGEVTSTS